jgi:hypothetical protein
MPHLNRDYANSTSSDFVSESSFVILKLRICPACSGSGAADGAGALPFHRAFNIELSDDRSAFSAGLFSPAVAA